VPQACRLRRSGDLRITGFALLADQRCRVSIRWVGAAFRHASDVLDCTQALHATCCRVELSEIRQWNEGGNRLAGALDDDALACGGVIQHLTKALSHVESRHGSHTTIIALYQFRNSARSVR
jgi:hypothetical protein